MYKIFKLIALTFVVLLVVAVGIGAWLLSRIDTKAQFEAAASEATGLTVKVEGGVALSFFPTLHASLKGVKVRNRAALVAEVGEADIGVELRPLFRQELRVSQLRLREVQLAIERDLNGQFNFIAPRSRTSGGSVPPAEVARLSFERASISYVDRQADLQLSASDCSFNGRDVRLTPGSSQRWLETLALQARVSCAKVSHPRLTATDVKATLVMQRGFIEMKPLELQVLGGKGSGEVVLDLAGLIPAYRLDYSIAQLRLEQLLELVGSEVGGTGPVDFNANLAMQGNDLDNLTRTSRGEVLLEGRDLTLAVGNLDQMLARYESSQNFNLVDVGAFFVAGPFGPALTKSYNFASIFRGTRGDTAIRRLVSQWTIEGGVARATDVVMATRANRVAVQGSLDFVNRSFQQMSVLLLNDQGCARVQQQINGTFAEPQIKRPSVLKALAGPMSRLFGRAKGLFGAKCEVKYEGSVPP